MCSPSLLEAHLGSDILIGGWADEREADEEYILETEQSKVGKREARESCMGAPPRIPGSCLPLCRHLSGDLTLFMPLWVGRPDLGTQKPQSHLQQVPCPHQTRHTGLAAHRDPTVH